MYIISSIYYLEIRVSYLTHLSVLRRFRESFIHRRIMLVIYNIRVSNKTIIVDVLYKSGRYTCNVLLLTLI